MTTPRVPEKDSTILGRIHAEAYDRMQSTLREHGWLETEELLHAGIMSGWALEIGSGPGYLGLDWLLRTQDTRLVGLDCSKDMVAIAAIHARELGLADRAEHRLGVAEAIPCAGDTFDSVFASRSLHEWHDPCAVFTELWRVLKPGGRLFISDLRRDVPPSARNFLERRMTSDVVLQGLRASLDAAYTAPEVTTLLDRTELVGCEVVETTLGLHVTGTKP